MAGERKGAPMKRILHIIRERSLLTDYRYVFRSNGPKHLDHDTQAQLGPLEECLLEQEVRDEADGMQKAMKKLRRKAREKGIEFVVNLDVRR